MEQNLITNKSTRNKCLDVYKGVSIIFVIITHHNWTDEQRINLLFPIWIDMAVPFFMVITGYVYTLSSTKKESKFLDNYHPKQVLIKWLRYIIPFVPVWIVGVIARWLGKGERFSSLALIADFFEGGIGPGSYYFPVMLQVVLMMPLIIWVIKRFREKGLIGLFVFNILYELIKYLLNMPAEWYRLCALRYVFILSFGCYLFVVGHSHKKIFYYIVGVIGLAYIVYYRFLGNTPLFTNEWTGSSVFAVLFTVPIMGSIIYSSKVKNRLFELLGKASYEIFLVQMIFYTVGDDIVRKVVPITFLQIIINIIVCCSVGVLYYKIEYPILMRIIKRVKK